VKNVISGFPVLTGGVETLIRQGGKTKQILIAYFLSNISATNYQNLFMYVKL